MNRAIDHLVHCAGDLEALRAIYQRLGFTLTPTARHPFGTANSLALLQGNFLELLTVADPAMIPPATPGHFSFGAFNETFLRRREGMSMLVFDSKDARRDQAEFAARGLDTYAPFDFSRKAKLPDGMEVEVSFSLAFVTDQRFPDAAFFACHQHTPEYFWKPEYQRHANTAERVVEVVMMANDPGALAEFFGRLIEPGAVRQGEGALTVSLGDGVLSVLDATRLNARFPGRRLRDVLRKPYFAGYSVRVSDLAVAESVLRQNGVGFERVGKALQVPAEQAFGAVVEFVG
ncbi:MAG TPA: VOC family protein [Stellaceae bacterium]|nr:VOC family protein [Stellaceae bacterium]